MTNKTKLLITGSNCESPESHRLKTSHIHIKIKGIRLKTEIMKFELRKLVRKTLNMYPICNVCKRVALAIMCAFLGGSYNVGMQNSI